MPYSRFLRFLQYEKRYSVHTITAYGKDLEQFFIFLDQTYSVKEPKEITHLFIRSWIVSLMSATGRTRNGEEQKMNSRSVRRKISSLKSFFKFLLREKQLKRNPMQKITSPKVAKKLPVFVDEQRMNLLLDNVEFNEGFGGVRDKLIISIFYLTGMRLSELINLMDKDINLHNLTVKVLGKRNKERVIPVAHSLKKEIEEYLQLRKTITTDKNAEQQFFISDKGNKMYRGYVYRLVRNKLGAVTTGTKKSPHVLRHTFATQMLNHGAEINAVKEILGHSSLAATQVYTHNTIEKLKNIYKQAHPKA